MAATFPTTPPSYPIDETYMKAQLSSRFEDGTRQVRAKYTKGRRKWRLNWKVMGETEYQNLLEYFEANQGSSFSWTDPFTTTVYTVMFTGDEIKCNASSVAGRDVSFEIEEIP